jgi:DNA-binding MarR family transcriptional regulator
MKNEFQTHLNTLEIFREIDPEFPIQMAVVFLCVAENEGINMTELYQKARISQSSISRNVAALSKWHRLNKEGHDLIFAKEDPRERRRKIVFLTQKGKLLSKVLKQQ